jgi:hypothetical protein
LDCELKGFGEVNIAGSLPNDALARVDRMMQQAVQESRGNWQCVNGCALPEPRAGADKRLAALKSKTQPRFGGAFSFLTAVAVTLITPAQPSARTAFRERRRVSARADNFLSIPSVARLSSSRSPGTSL